jgi:hypothetical protein
MGPDDDGTFLLEVDRQAPCLPDALVTALSELMSVLPDATVLRVGEYDLATMADIAKRSGRTPESIRLLVSGKRGPGGFHRLREASMPAPRSPWVNSRR